MARPRKPFEEKERHQVETLASFGLTDVQIAAVMQVSERCLQYRCRDELRRGRVIANVRVMETLYEMATSGKNVAAAIFWLKARAGWRDCGETTTDRPLPTLKIEIEEKPAPVVDATPTMNPTAA